MNEELNKDPILLKLLKNSISESPSDDFTQKLMNKILTDESKSKIAINESFISKYGYLFISTFLLISAFSVFFLFPQYFEFFNIKSIHDISYPIISIFKDFFAFVKSQNIFIIVISSIIGLIIFDKLLSKLFHIKIQAV